MSEIFLCAVDLYCANKPFFSKYLDGDVRQRRRYHKVQYKQEHEIVLESGH